MAETANRRARSGRGRVRLDEVAARAGVSTATVSRVFNAPDRVSAAVRERVEAAARALDWVPDAAGRALASSRTHIVGAIIPTLDNEIFARQVNGLQRVFAEHGFTLLLGCSNYDPAESLRQVRAMLARGVEAVALVGEDHPPALWDALHRFRVPYVVLYGFQPNSPHPCVGFDNRAAFDRLASHLVALGHRRIAVALQPLLNNSRVAARLDGVRDSLSRHGLALTERDLLVGASSMAFGAEAFARFRDRSDPPTALLCGNDAIAIGAIMAATAAGISVPNRLSVSGFDDLAIASLLSPSLTSMRVDNLLIGETAATLLLEQLVGDAAPRSVEIVPVLRPRASTAAPPNG